MCLKFKENVTNPLIQINLINDDLKVVFELALLTSNIKEKIVVSKIIFLFFSKKDVKK
jgi:hypothetical protein